MKLSRRKFFGAAAGAGAAASLNGDLLGSAPGMGMPIGYPRSGGTSPAVPAPDPHFLAREQERLSKIARGELDGWSSDQVEDSETQARNTVAIANIDILRSVSPSHKRQMLAEHYRRTTTHHFMRQAKRSLRDLFMMKG